MKFLPLLAASLALTLGACKTVNSSAGAQSVVSSAAPATPSGTPVVVDAALYDSVVKSYQAFGDDMLFPPGAEVDGATLKGAALASYKKAKAKLPENVQVLSVRRVKAGGIDTIAVVFNNDGNGYVEVFTEGGEPIAGIGFTESEIYAWEPLKPAATSQLPADMVAQIRKTYESFEIIFAPPGTKIQAASLKGAARAKYDALVSAYDGSVTTISLVRVTNGPLATVAVIDNNDGNGTVNVFTTDEGAFVSSYKFNESSDGGWL